MIRIFFIGYFLLVYCSLFSQPNYVNEDGGTLQMGNLDVPFLRVSETSGNKIVGSIYLNEEWEQATIVNLSNNKKIKLLARFNAYHSEIEILGEKEISALFTTDGIEVTLNNKSFVPLKIEKRNKAIFAEILFKGKYNLYKVFDVKIIRAPSDAKLLNLESVDRVEILNDYYFNENGGEAVQVPKNKKSMKSVLPSNFLEILKKEKLSLKKEEDLVTLFSLINSN